MINKPGRAAFRQGVLLLACLLVVEVVLLIAARTEHRSEWDHSERDDDVPVAEFEYRHADTGGIDSKRPAIVESWDTKRPADSVTGEIRLQLMNAADGLDDYTCEIWMETKTGWDRVAEGLLAEHFRIRFCGLKPARYQILVKDSLLPALCQGVHLALGERVTLTLSAEFGSICILARNAAGEPLLTGSFFAKPVANLQGDPLPGRAATFAAFPSFGGAVHFKDLPAAVFELTYNPHGERPTEDIALTFIDPKSQLSTLEPARISVRPGRTTNQGELRFGAKK